MAGLLREASGSPVALDAAVDALPSPSGAQRRRRSGSLTQAAGSAMGLSRGGVWQDFSPEALQRSRANRQREDGGAGSLVMIEGEESGGAPGSGVHASSVPVAVGLGRRRAGSGAFAGVRAADMAREGGEDEDEAWRVDDAVDRARMWQGDRKGVMLVGKMSTKLERAVEPLGAHKAVSRAGQRSRKVRVVRQVSGRAAETLERAGRRSHEAEAAAAPPLTVLGSMQRQGADAASRQAADAAAEEEGEAALV